MGSGMPGPSSIGSVGANDSAKGSGMPGPSASGGCADSVKTVSGEPTIMAAAIPSIGASILGGR